MALPNVPYGTQQILQLSELDTTFAAVGALGVIPCTASGVNTLTLTPQANTPSVTAYANYQQFSFAAPADSTGPVTASVSGLAALKVFMPGGTTQATAANLSSGAFYVVAYVQALDGGGGGLVIVSAAASVGGVSKVAQFVYNETGAVSTGTTVIPLDDTIPQQSGPAEGDQYLSQAITPTNAGSTLVIEVLIFGSSSVANVANIVALFQDAIASALDVAVGFTFSGAPGVYLRHVMVAGTTSPTTFKVRIGPSAAATFTFNGTGGGRLFGGVFGSSISITEYTP